MLCIFLCCLILLYLFKVISVCIKNVNQAYNSQPMSYLPTSRRVFEQPSDPFNYERVQQSAPETTAAQQF